MDFRETVLCSRASLQSVSHTALRTLSWHPRRGVMVAATDYSCVARASRRPACLFRTDGSPCGSSIAAGASGYTKKAAHVSAHASPHMSRGGAHVSIQPSPRSDDPDHASETAGWGERARSHFHTLPSPTESHPGPRAPGRSREGDRGRGLRFGVRGSA